MGKPSQSPIVIPPCENQSSPLPSGVTGELEKAGQAFDEMLANYPRDGRMLNDAALIYAALGDYEKAIPMTRRSIELSPDFAGGYGNLANDLIATQNFDEAGKVLQQEAARGIDEFLQHNALYFVSFARGDSAAMAAQEQWFAGHADVQSFGLSLAADSEAYAGHLAKARVVTQQAAESAMQHDSRENGALWLENGSLREAAFGNFAAARQAAAAGLKLVPASEGVAAQAALAYALAGDADHAEALAQDLNTRFPSDTQMQGLWLPAIHAQLALNRKDAAGAITDLQPAMGSVLRVRC
jgi:tetratricopeptide (TPR) repeat protein